MFLRLHFVQKCIRILEPESPLITEHLLKTRFLHADLKLQMWAEQAVLETKNFDCLWGLEVQSDLQSYRSVMEGLSGERTIQC
ncbi:hypothetical protein PoB_005282700 [Plakobranchus ocellatus]|uniref:Uncharacterized protein n=1 Tax=Plakobranchus ocellatus TaxID=259542 RepID=A0AAV4C3Z7_9GAST|nr:hypothetical protein PoB_005282700 [Plakobranchus ocellatus]